jgi:hypothetical protein
MTTQLQRAGFATRIVYSAGLFSLLPGTLVVNSGWIGLAMGGSLAAAGSMTAILVLAAGAVFRIYQVMRYPHALDAYVPNKFVATLRVLAYIAMLVGGVAGIGLFLVRPLALLIFKAPGEAGIAYFVTAVYLAVGTSLGWKGCLAFEISRWFGRRPQDAPQRPAFRWKQDVVVAGLLVALFVGAPHLRRATAPTPCGQNRIACVAKLESHIKRMVAAPLDTPVYLESAINSVRMQVRSGSSVRWEVTESPYTSLQAAGYPPSTDSGLRVRVKLDVRESNEGVLVGLYVSDADEETARFVISFPRGSRLEHDASGKLNVIAELPVTSDSLRKGSWRDDRGDDHTIDQLFVLLRQAIGTEVEAKEHNLQIVSTAVLTAHADHVDGNRSIEEIRLGDYLEKQCHDRVTRTRGAGVRSYADADRGWELMHLQFNAASTRIYVHSTDDVVCLDETTWIVHQVPMEPFIILRRYAADGTLLRFVQSPLPAMVASERFAFVDAASVRETGDSIWFDRIEVARGKRIGDPYKVIGLDTFRIPLAEER